MSVELRTAVEAVNRGFDEFKAANDKRLAEIEKKGSADSLTVERVENLSTKLGELGERQRKIETRLSRPHLGGGDADAEETKAARQFFTAVSGRPVAASDVDVGAYGEYQRAFVMYLHHGEKMLSPDQTKALSVGVDAAGGYFVSAEMDNAIVKRLFESSPMRSLARIVTARRDSFEFPIDSNDLVSGGWVGETDARAETATPEVGKGRISTHEQFANPRNTQKLLDDSDFPVEQWLTDKIGDKLTRDEATAFVSGNGVARPRGFLNYSGAATTQADSARSWGVLQYVATGAAGGFDSSTVDATASPADELVDLVATLNPGYRPNATWLMNRSLEALIQKIKDNDGNYIWRASDIQRGSPASLLGYPLALGEDLPDAATDSFSVAFGNFRQAYLILERQGTRTLRDPFSAKPYVQFYTTRRVGGDVVNFDAIKLLKMGVS